MKVNRAAMFVATLGLLVGCPDEDSGGDTTTSGETTAGGTTSGGTTSGDTTAGGTTGGGTTGGSTTSGGTTGGSTTGGTTGGDTCDASEEAFCNGNQVFKCKSDGSGYDTETCSAGCEAGACVGCTDGPAQCSEDKKMTTQCVGGEIVETTCPELCKDGKCVDAETICEAADVFCDEEGSRLLKCADDGLSANTHEPCPHGCADGADMCLPAACDAGERRCAPEKPLLVEVCNAKQTGWDQAPSECEDECKDGTCIVFECDAGFAKCGAVGVETCNEEQNGYDKELCKSGCLETPDGPVCAKCKDGLTECQGQTVMKCADPQVGWSEVKTCSELQQCAGSQCLDVVVLSGSGASTYVLLLKAFADCYSKATPGLCRSIDMTDASADITEEGLRTWFCDSKDAGEPALAALFDSEAQYEVAKTIVGCSTFDEQDMDFQVEAITKGQSAVHCIGYSKSISFSNPNLKEVIVKACTDFKAE